MPVTWTMVAEVRRRHFRLMFRSAPTTRIKAAHLQPSAKPVLLARIRTTNVAAIGLISDFEPVSAIKERAEVTADFSGSSSKERVLPENVGSVSVYS